MARTLPLILVRQFNTNEVSGGVPGDLVKTYEALKKTAYDAFSKDPKLFDIHFHLEEGKCEGKIIAFLWDTQSYFKSELVHDGKFNIFAHFEKFAAPKLDTKMDKKLSAVPISSQRSSTALPRQLPTNGTGYIPSMKRGISEESDDIPLSKLPRSAFNPGVGKLAKSTKDRLNVHTINDDESDMRKGNMKDKTQKKSASSTPKRRERKSLRRVAPRYDSQVHPPFPQGRDQTTWVATFKIYRTQSPPVGSTFYRPNWETLSEGTKTRIAHARLMAEEYGIISPQPCTACKTAGKECRIYHPKMFGSEFKGTILRPGTCCSRCTEKPAQAAGPCDVFTAE